MQPTCKGSQYVCKKKCFPRLIKVEKMMSGLKTLQDELREEVSQKNTVHINRELSKDVSVTPSFEGACNVKFLMKSINKALFPSNATEHSTRFPLALSNYWISNTQAFSSSCGPRISQLCKHLDQ